MPVIQCPHCRTSVEIHADDVGYKVLCPSCNSAFQAGEVGRPAPEPVSRPAPEPPPPDSGERAVRCTACRGEVAVGVEDIGHKVECPLCGDKFRAEDGSRRDSSESRSRRSERFDDDDDDEHDDRRGGYGGYRGRNRIRDEDKGYILDTARNAIAWPANGLMWTGIISTALCLLIGGGLLIGGIITNENAVNARDREPAVMMIIYGVLIAGFGIPFHLVLGIAGYKMRQLNGTGWAYTGAIVAMTSIVFTGACSPTTWAAMTFGIWAVIALSKREVKDAIAINTGKGL